MEKKFKTKATAVITAAIFSISILLTACGGSSSGGSNAAGIPANMVKVSGASVQLVQDLVNGFKTSNSTITINVQENDSTQGIKDVSDGTSDIAVSNRELTSDEKNLGLTEKTLTNDGVAVVVNTANQVAKLSKDQLAKIFGGEITNWKDVGGADGDIMVVNDQSGADVQKTFEEKLGITVTPNALAVDGAGAVKAILASRDNAISFIPLGDVDDTVKEVTTDGVELAIPIILLSKSTPRPEAQAFLDYIAGDGQQIINK